MNALAPDAPIASLPREAWAVALASLPRVGPARLRALLRLGDPRATWEDEVLNGRVHRHEPVAAHMGKAPAALASLWRDHASVLDPAELWRSHVEAGVGVAALETSAMPAVLSDDVAPPGVLFWLGDPDVVAGCRVGIIGTRDCTRYGRDLASELGRDLASAGVAVVSGLALGIDGAAHRGALEAEAAPPIGVVGSGLDVVYPRGHSGLWRDVAGAGVLFSEYPLGSGSDAWHFPTRNRIIAALADVLVVVESHEWGGSMHTVEHAQRRQKLVMAVPGPVRSPASAGTNKLLSEGVSVARDVTDVLVAIGLERPAPRPSGERRPAPAGDGQVVLDALGWQPATFEQLVVRSGLALSGVASALDQLQADGWVDQVCGWYERVATPTG